MEEYRRISKIYNAARAARHDMNQQIVPRNVLKAIKQDGRHTREATVIQHAAFLTLNVVDFTYLAKDGTPEELTSILDKLFDMVDGKLESYGNLFKVIKVQSNSSDSHEKLE